MNRDQIIAKTIVDMCHHENLEEDCEPGSDNAAAAYDSDVVVPEMLKRLPEGEITTCAELGLTDKCCDSCHAYYPHYDMEVVQLSDGRAGWICCAVRRFLFPETSIPEDSQEFVDLMQALGGFESDGPDT
jgi:hypothetical protein